MTRPLNTHFKDATIEQLQYNAHGSASMLLSYVTAFRAQSGLTEVSQIYHGRELKDPTGDEMTKAVQSRNGWVVAKESHLYAPDPGEPETSSDDFSFLWGLPEALIHYYDGGQQITIRASEAKFQAAHELLMEMTKVSAAPEPRATVYMMGSTPSGVQLMHVGMAGIPLVESNYSAEVMSTLTNCLTELKSRTPKGRLLLLSGPPGSGKTTLIRSLLNRLDSTIIFIPAGDVVNLSGPAIVPVLLNGTPRHRPITFIVEDADSLIAIRERESMTGLAVLLNLSDGILGDLLDIRVLATTNATADNIDPALLRPGRILAHMHIGAMNPERATSCLQALLGDTSAEIDLSQAANGANGEVLLSEVYAQARVKGWVPLPAVPQYNDNDDDDLD